MTDLSTRSFAELMSDLYAAEKRLAEALARKPSLCTAQDRNRDECRAETDGICHYCGEAVCIRCTEACLTCGADLHPECRADHAKESKHRIDLPTVPDRPLRGDTVITLMETVDACLRRHPGREVATVFERTSR